MLCNFNSELYLKPKTYLRIVFLVVVFLILDGWGFLIFLLYFCNKFQASVYCDPWLHYALFFLVYKFIEVFFVPQHKFVCLFLIFWKH